MIPYATSNNSEANSAHSRGRKKKRGVERVAIAGREANARESDRHPEQDGCERITRLGIFSSRPSAILYDGHSCRAAREGTPRAISREKRQRARRNAGTAGRRDRGGRVGSGREDRPRRGTRREQRERSYLSSCESWPFSTASPVPPPPVPPLSASPFFSKLCSAMSSLKSLFSC